MTSDPTKPLCVCGHKALYHKDTTGQCFSRKEGAWCDCLGFASDTHPAETGRQPEVCRHGIRLPFECKDCLYAPVSPEPPLNVRLKGDKDKGRFCIHGVELIKWCKICDGVGTVDATPEPVCARCEKPIRFQPDNAENPHIGIWNHVYGGDALNFRGSVIPAASLPSPAPQDADNLLREALMALAALVVSGECTDAESALCTEIKTAVMKSHDAILEYFSASPAQPVGSADKEQK